MTVSRLDLLALILLGALTLGISFGGSTSIPIDAHEVYVAQTAENMIERGDWVVPVLNDELRLRKPPLSYWATAAVTLIGDSHEVTPLDARLPSIVAGLGLILLVFLIGRGERGRATGLLAGTIALTTAAFFSDVHDARPDMLYAFFATLMVYTYWAGSRTSSVAGRLGWPWLFWIAFALDTLTKGPQFGAMVLAACAIHALATTRDWRLTAARLRPLSGLILFAAVTLPWWWLLNQRVGPQLEDSQLAGSLLSVNPLRLLHPFYWLRTPLLWAPWLIAIVPAVAVAWRERGRTPGLLALVVLLPILVFTLGPQYREIYMLPSLGSAALLLAFGIERFASPTRRWHTAGFWVLTLFMLVFVVGGLGWLLLHSQASLASAVLCALAALALVALAIVQLRRAPASGSRLGAITLIGMAVAVALVQAAVVPEVWSPSRYNDRALALRLTPYRDAPMAVFDKLAPEVFVYYLDRPVRHLENEADLCTWLASVQGRRPLVLYVPAQAERVESVLSKSKPLMQSPGSARSAVTVVRVPPHLPIDCGARS